VLTILEFSRGEPRQQEKEARQEDRAKRSG